MEQQAAENANDVIVLLHSCDTLCISQEGLLFLKTIPVYPFAVLGEINAILK